MAVGGVDVWGEMECGGPEEHFLHFSSHRLSFEKNFLLTELLLMSIESIEDISHLKKIRERLWHGQTSGRAALFLGSGFSRNANPVTSPPQPFPLWKDLAPQLIYQLHPSAENDREEMNRHLQYYSGPSGLLRLAEEYCTEHGRVELDHFLHTNIPDLHYEPGDVHIDLLSLPWADVFTTNYDTLIERACRKIYGRRYDFVYKPSDIPRTRQPRIVKLHGSFPAHDPYIISESDFRKYPETHSPFVNMVQQSLMENVLVVLGFSGDDPNFLQWTGWVRDRLRDSTPYIYLIGSFSLTRTQKALLKNRRINVVNLSPIAPSGEAFTESGRKESIRSFIRYLREGKPTLNLQWPR